MPELKPEPETGPLPERVAEPSCEARIELALASPAEPGFRRLDESRAAFLAKVKAEPLLFVRAPEYVSEPSTLPVRGYRQMLLSGRNPFGTVSRILEESAGFQKQAREALLRDGYLFADTPELGSALVDLVEPQHLFGGERIWVQRGESTWHALRRSGRFHFTDGPLAGRRVRFVLFDRAGYGEAPPPPLHRDLRALRRELHFDRMRVRHVTETQIIADLRYGARWIPSLLAARGAHLSLECETIADADRDGVAATRAEAARRELALQSLRRVILEEVDEALPFDEPVHEYGFQYDGLLRWKWSQAYEARRRTYDFTGDAYDVFDAKGRPLVPQVCVDFLTDTFERTSGTWFRGPLEPPGRNVGKLDFDAMPEAARLELRRAPGFIAFAKTRPDAFEVAEDFPQIALGDEEALYGYLADHAADFSPGDAVLLRGKTPWDPEHVHFHSFFVYESDPITGMPVLLAGNAGRPSLRVWRTEARRTPKRTIVARVRPRTSWLESIVAVPPLEGVPPLTADPG